MPFDAARAEAARQDDAVDLAKQLVHGGVVDLFRVYPVNVNEAAGFVTAVLQRLCNREICVVQLDVLADQCNLNVVLAGGNALRAFPATRSYRPLPAPMDSSRQTMSDRWLSSSIIGA